MFTRSRFLAFALAVLATLASVSAADAGWVTFKNDTQKTIVVQEFIVLNGKKVTGRPYKLGAGESFREFQNNAGVKNYEFLDTKGNPLASGPLSCKKDSQSFSIMVTPQGKVTVMPVAEAKKP